jgi:hypothetical protein
MAISAVERIRKAKLVAEGGYGAQGYADKEPEYLGRALRP